MPDVTRRHVLAAALGLLGAGAAGAYVQSGDGDGQAALGGATPEQDVEVLDYFVVLAGELREAPATDAVYNGIEWGPGSSIALERGEPIITLEETSQ